jgi:hypothetical protein
MPSAEALYTHIGTSRWPVEQLGWERWLQPARAALRERAAAAATAVGRPLTIDEAIAEALEVDGPTAAAPPIAQRRRSSIQ